MSTTILDQLLQDHHEYGHEVADFLLDAAPLLATSQLDSAMKLEVLSHFEAFGRKLLSKGRRAGPLARQEKALVDRIQEQDPAVNDFIAQGLAALALGLMTVMSKSPSLAKALATAFKEFLNGFMSDAEIDACEAETAAELLNGGINMDEMTGDLILLANGIRP